MSLPPRPPSPPRPPRDSDHLYSPFSPLSPESQLPRRPVPQPQSQFQQQRPQQQSQQPQQQPQPQPQQQPQQQPQASSAEPSDEKEVARLSGPPERWLYEKEFVSPVTPVTDYNKRPYEFPQAMLVDQKFPQAMNVDGKYLVGERDMAEEAPQVVEPSPPYLSRKDTADTERGYLATPISPDDATMVGAGSIREGPAKESDKQKQRICGLARTTFWIVLLVVFLVIIAVAVGGGVGASVANKNRDVQAAAASSAAAASLSALLASASSAGAHPATTNGATVTTGTATATTTKASKASATSSAAGGLPTGWYIQVWSHKNFTGETRKLTNVGIFATTFPDDKETLPNPWGDPSDPETATYNTTLANSYVWVPLSTGCCVRFCNDNESVGFRCISETHQPDASIDKVVMACGATPDESDCKGTGLRKREVEAQGGQMWEIAFK